MSKPIDMHHFWASPFSRHAWIVGKISGLDINTIITNLPAGEHMTPEFLKMNPLHTVPTINDNGYFLYESRAVAIYFVEKSKNYSLYPQDIQKRGIVNRMLFWESGSFGTAVLGATMPHIFGREMGGAEREKAEKKRDDKLAQLGEFLSKSKFVAGDEMSLPDIGIFTYLTMLQLVNHDFEKTPKINEFMLRMLENAAVKEAQVEAEKCFEQMKARGFFKAGEIRKFT